MKAISLPEKVDIFRDAAIKRKLAFELPLDSLKRVHENVPLSCGVVIVDIQFDQDADGFAYINLLVSADLTLPCDRCLEPMTLPLSLSRQLSPVSNFQEADALPKRYEPVDALEGQVDLKSVIEDEILLAIPMHPKHDASACEVQLIAATQNELEEHIQQPFIGLAELLENEPAQ